MSMRQESSQFLQLVRFFTLATALLDSIHVSLAYGWFAQRGSRCRPRPRFIQTLRDA
jgi:hypothetical protein